MNMSHAVISAACVLALAAGARAQQVVDEGASDQRVPVAGKTTLGVSVSDTELLAPGVRASKLIGTEVKNDANKKVGKIDDLIVTPDGKLSVAVVDVGGFIGLAGRKVAIPVAQFQSLTAGRPVLPGATEDELKKLPEFKYTKQ